MILYIVEQLWNMVTKDCGAWDCYQVHYLFSWHRGGNLVNLRWKSFSEKDGTCPVDRTSKLAQQEGILVEC